MSFALNLSPLLLRHHSLLSAHVDTWTGVSCAYLATVRQFAVTRLHLGGQGESQGKDMGKGGGATGQKWQQMLKCSDMAGLVIAQSEKSYRTRSLYASFMHRTSTALM